MYDDDLWSIADISIHALRKESDTILRQSMEGKTWKTWDTRTRKPFTT